MEKINQILINIQSSIQYIIDAVIGLAFQPLYVIVAIIQSLIEIWSPDEEEEGEPQVTQYPSTNVGRFADEVEYPIGRNKIGFHINENEANEINEIKKQLNK